VPPRGPEPNSHVGPPAAGGVAPVANGGAQPPAPAGHAAPPPVAQTFEEQAAELAVLQARLAQLEANRRATPVPPPVPPVLFVNQDVIDGARAAAVTTKDSDKKPSLPNVIPGYKANSLDVRK
jgi:hypothetical protein